ncbi:LOW QUALITY PROTEIN: DLA class II histocompatibility antigen, DR-1 beta chain-like [Dugong dugon]
MVCLWFPRGTWMAALTLRLMVLSPPLALSGDTSHFLEQVKSECHFTNGTERVRFLERHVYNRAECARFDSDVGEFVAVTKLGISLRKKSRSNLFTFRLVENPLDSNFFCFVLFFSPPGFENGIEERKNGSQTRVTLSSSLVLSAFSLLVEPVVTVYPAKTQPLQHHNLLVCSVNGFYPGHTEVRWFRNGQEEESGVVSTGLIQNGDWTFQILVMLETIPQSGEVYSCQVEHPSLTSPVTVEWRSQSECTQSKMLSGIGGLVLGLLFLGVGLFIHFRNQKAHSGLQPTGCCNLRA